MSRASKTAQEFIQDSFSPIIGVLCSQKVDNVVSKNNLSFTELLQPFAIMDWEGQFREPGGTICTIKNWKLVIRDVNWKPLQPTEARRHLNNAALHNYNDKSTTLELEGRKFDVPNSTTWFDAWRETYLDVQFPSDHEFTKRFISCIIVGTTQDDNIIDTFNALNQQYAQLQNVAPPKLPKWFTSGVLKSYLLLHDVSAVPKDKADATFETLKQTFGASNCFMITINSKIIGDQTFPPDYWVPYIKRTSETNNETSVANPAITPSEPPKIYQPPTDDSTISSTVPEGMHPLTTTENDFYDNANSLQTHSFSGSSESVNVPAKVLDYSTEVHGAALNASDIDEIKKFMHEYASKALLPYFEKQIAQLSEVVANRKGVSRSLLSATKRWFGTGKTGNTTGNSAVIYTSDCPELQLRRLGDLWFLCGQWQRAYDAYHTAKREFYADSAWLCYAGALEMAAISAFMAGEANRKTHGYMEESIVTYLNTCRMVQYAVRATLLSVLCLSSSGLHGEAAKQLIRMTSEDSDLRSAMLLEQAALCFLSGPGAKAMCRKYAFHMVLAGHRFSKAGQKKHAYRCYKQAYQVYCESGWRLSTDHVQFALGRLAGALRQPRDAVRWLAAPLAPASHQPAHQQDAFLREYTLAHQQWIENCSDFKDRLPVLPLPLIERHSTAVLCVGPVPLSSPGRSPATSLSLRDPPAKDDATWNMLEEMLLHVAQGTQPMIFKPTIDLYTENTDGNPVVPQGEPMQISITLRNPLKISLVLRDLELLWEFVSVDEGSEGSKETLNNEPTLAAGCTMDNSVIVGEKIKSVLMEGETTNAITFSLTPMRVGHLTVRGLAYKLINAGEGGNENASGATISGKVELMSGVSSTDKRLCIVVVPRAPCLQMTFSETSPNAISGEIRTIDVEFRNVGPVDMKNVFIAVSHPECIHLLAGDEEMETFKHLYEDKYYKPPPYSDERAARTGAWRTAGARACVRAANSVASGATVRSRLLIRPHATASALRLMAYYEPAVVTTPVLLPTVAVHVRAYRLLRHVFNFTVTETVEVTVMPRRTLRTIDDETVESMNMSIEIKNISNPKDEDIGIEVLDTSLLSRQWILTDLTAAGDKGDRLASREKLHLILKARRLRETLSDGKVEWSCLKIAEQHPDSVPNINTSPYSKFVTDYKLPFIDNVEKFNVAEKNNNGLIRSMFVIRWKAYDKVNKKSVVGQHCLWLDCFTKCASREKEIILPEAPTIHLSEYDSRSDILETRKTNVKDNVVVFKMEHSNQIQHNFNQRKLCLVPITINIVNCYGVPVKVFIDMSKQQNRESCGELGWAGALSHGTDIETKEFGVSVSLGKFESRRLQVRAVCGAPGAYLVGAAFTATTATAERTLSTHVSDNTSLLIVQQAA